MRSEMIKRLTDAVAQLSDVLQKKANSEEVRRLSEEKLDLNIFKTAI